MALAALMMAVGVSGGLMVSAAAAAQETEPTAPVEEQDGGYGYPTPPTEMPHYPTPPPYTHSPSPKPTPSPTETPTMTPSPEVKTTPPHENGLPVTGMDGVPVAGAGLLLIALGAVVWFASGRRRAST